MFIFGLLVLGGAILGGIGIGAKCEAHNRYQSANNQLQQAIDRLNKARERIEELEKEFVSVYEKLKNDLRIISSRLNINISSIVSDLKDRELINLPEEIGIIDEISYILTGALFGSKASLVAYASAIKFGKASTGTAISMLSGAAQKNAALAWLGGGAKTAGGLGITGGIIGLTAIALGVGIFMWGIASDVESCEYYAEVQKKIEEIEKQISAINILINELSIMICKIRTLNLFNERVSSLLYGASANPYRSSHLIEKMRDFYIKLLTEKLRKYFQNGYSVEALKADINTQLETFQKLYNEINWA